MLSLYTIRLSNGKLGASKNCTCFDWFCCQLTQWMSCSFKGKITVSNTNVAAFWSHIQVWKRKTLHGSNSWLDNFYTPYLDNFCLTCGSNVERHCSQPPSLRSCLYPSTTWQISLCNSSLLITWNNKKKKVVKHREKRFIKDSKVII